MLQARIASHGIPITGLAPAGRARDRLVAADAGLLRGGAFLVVQKG
jgi:hypothetical protein